MGYDDRDEIIERLEALERMLRSRGDERDGRDDRRRGHHDRRRPRDERGMRGERDRRGGERDGRGGDRDEKRIIDTIVHLVTENLGRHLQDREARQRNRGGGGDEKRVVDLIVGLVSERVQEIVACELDRRLGQANPPQGCEDDGAAGESEEA